MAYELTEIDGQELSEPVTLAEVKAYSVIDLDYNSTDGELDILITTARVRLEQYLNVGLLKRNVRLQWHGDPIDLPLSPINEIVSVSDKDGVLDQDKYNSFGFGNIGLVVKGLAYGDFEYFYDTTNMLLEVQTTAFIDGCKVFTAVYDCGFENIPNGLKQAILAEVDYLKKLKGMPVTDLISPNAALLASGYSKNLVL